MSQGQQEQQETGQSGRHRLRALAESGVSIWLDDLSRERLETGNLGGLVEHSSVVGVTTNPSIFAKALSEGERYADQVRDLAAEHADVDEAVFALTTTDVRWACDVLRPTWEATGGVDGRVSIEVPPGLAHDTDATIAAAKRLHDGVDRENVFVKIPATAAGAPAITAVLAAGISVNVTLIFGLERYQQVMAAHAAGLEQARDNGLDITAIHSVASFFVSRVDAEIDRRLDEIGTDTARRMKGRAAIANARLAHRDHRRFVAGERFTALQRDGARTQRPLWASTSVKDPDYPDTMYVTELVTPDTVNTMPESTLRAFADHGEVHGDRVIPAYEEADAVMDGLAELGVDYDDVVRVLEREGVEKFSTSWEELRDTVRDNLRQAAR